MASFGFAEEGATLLGFKAGIEQYCRTCFEGHIAAIVDPAGGSDGAAGGVGAGGNGQVVDAAVAVRVDDLFFEFVTRSIVGDVELGAIVKQDAAGQVEGIVGDGDFFVFVAGLLDLNYSLSLNYEHQRRADNGTDRETCTSGKRMIMTFIENEDLC